MNQAQSEVEESKTRIQELTETIALMEATRTTVDTSIEELELLYPEIVQEIDEEIGKYEWEKDA